MYVTRRRVCERGKREGTGRHDSCLHRSTRGRPLHVLQLLGETLACLPQVPYLPIPSYRLARACFSHEDNASYLRSLPEPEISTPISIDLVYQQSSSLIAKKAIKYLPTLVLRPQKMSTPIDKALNSKNLFISFAALITAATAWYVHTYLRPLTFHRLPNSPI